MHYLVGIHMYVAERGERKREGEREGKEEGEKMSRNYEKKTKKKTKNISSNWQLAILKSRYLRNYWFLMFGPVEAFVQNHKTRHFMPI